MGEDDQVSPNAASEKIYKCEEGIPQQLTSYQSLSYGPT
jgi:hypothetical protein